MGLLFVPRRRNPNGGKRRYSADTFDAYPAVASSLRFLGEVKVILTGLNPKCLPVLVPHSLKYLMPCRGQYRRRSWRKHRELTLLPCIVLFFVLYKWFLPSSVSAARLAYAIQLSPANYHLLPRLMRALYDRDNYYALHFDPKISASDARQKLEELRNTLQASGISYRHENIVVLKPEIITYRGITMTLNFLTGAEKLLSLGEWDFFINLSGADFPIASQKIMKKLLYRTRNANFVEWKPRRTWASYANRRLGHFYIDTGLVTTNSENGSYLTGHGNYEIDAPDESAHLRNPMADHVDFTIAKSSGWFILCRRFTKFLLRNSQSKKLLIALAYSDASDEHYFGSMLWNSRFRDTVIDSNMRHIFFVAPNGSFALGADGKRRRQHPFWVDELDEDGRELMFWPQIWNEPAFFTRKIRGMNRFCERVEREMIGIGDSVDGARVAEYERTLTKSFSAHAEPFLEKTIGDDDEED